MYTDTIYKLEKKIREKIIRKYLIIAYKKGYQYKFFIQLLKCNPCQISNFVKGHKGLHKNKLDILENYFGIQSQKTKEN